MIDMTQDELVDGIMRQLAQEKRSKVLLMGLVLILTALTPWDREVIVERVIKERGTP